MVPQAAREQYDDQQALAAVVIRGVSRAWRRMRGRRWSTAWRDDVGPQVSQVVEAGQAAAAARSSQYVTEVLAELGVKAQADTDLMSEAFSGAAGNGRSVESQTYGAVITAVKAQYSPDYASLEGDALLAAALGVGDRELRAIVAGVMADTARAAETAAIAQRPWLTGYSRMIEPGACSRCAVLAGKFYLFNEGFLRHERCRCVHIPTTLANPSGALSTPSEYFDSLSTAEQDRIFTKAGAEAIRQGADISQVVNARRGMTTAQRNPAGWIAKGRLIPTNVNGRPTYTTTTGITRRGSAAGVKVRLMPESIVSIARDPEDLRRLLIRYGYIT